MRQHKKLLSLLLALLFASALLSTSVFAAGAIELDASSTLTLTYHDGKTPLEGAHFSLYLVAEFDRFGNLTPLEEFEQFNIDIHGQNDEAWRVLASTLEGYVLRDKLEPVDQGATDRHGVLSFPTAQSSLISGLYLVLGSRHIQNDQYYYAAPFLITLPSPNQDDNSWNYDVSAFPKSSSRPIPDESETTKRKVIKRWANDNDELRPQEITVQLLCDGEIYDTVVLSSENGWKYTWPELDSGYQWNITELTPEDYTVSIYREGVTFVVTNTGNQPDDESGPQAVSSSPEFPDVSRLPQTGQLWWPVPALLCTGLLLIIIGVLKKRGKADED